MIKKFLDSLENPERPLLGPNYWALRKMGLLLPKNKLGKMCYILMHELASFFVFTQFIELYVIRSDLDLVLINLKISMLSVVCIIKVNTFLFWQKSWIDVINYVNEADKFERENSGATWNKIISKYTKYSRRMTHLYWMLVYTTSVTAVATPLITYLSSPTFRENLSNGTANFPHIFSSWMPFNKNKPPGNCITILWHTAICAYGASIMCAYDTTAVVIMVYFGGKLELLRERCKQICGEISNSSGDNAKDFSRSIGQLHQIHAMLIKHSRLFNSLLSPVMLFYMVICSIMLCASAYQLTSVTSAAEKLLMAEYLVFGILQLFFFCWHSNDVLIKNDNVILGPYESKWWAATLRQRKDILLLAGQLRIKNEFTAGPFASLTLPTFLTIIKGAYSYYTLLRK